MLGKEDYEPGLDSFIKKEAEVTVSQEETDEDQILPAQDENFRNYIVRYNQNVNGTARYESNRYFQIIDDTGLYISDSGNVNSFAEDLNIWKELERYEIADGITVEQIRENAESGRSGEF